MNPRLLELLDRIAEDAPDPEAAAELEELLHDDPQAVALAADHLATVRLLEVSAAGDRTEQMRLAVRQAIARDASSFVRRVRERTRGATRRRAARRSGRRRVLPVILGLTASVVVLLVWLLPSPPDPLRTVEGPALERLADGTRLRLGEGARLQIRTDSDLVLLQGSLLAEVVPQRQTLTITAGTGRITVLGTRFRVQRRASGCRVDVIEGRVGLETTGSTGGVEIGAGAWAAITDGAVSQVHPLGSDPQGTGPRVAAWRLVDPVSKQPLPGYELLLDGQRVQAADLPPDGVDVEAVLEGTPVGSVFFARDGEQVNFTNEDLPPYTMLGGKVGDDRVGWRPEPGPYRLQARAHAEGSYRGTVLAQATLRLHIE